MLDPDVVEKTFHVAKLPKWDLELKTLKKDFSAIWEGKKLFELRRYAYHKESSDFNAKFGLISSISTDDDKIYIDRDFFPGQIILLREYNDTVNFYTGKMIFVSVEYILSDVDYPNALKIGHCIMSINVLHKVDNNCLYYTVNPTSL